MNVSLLLIVFCTNFVTNYARLPFKPPKEALPFAVYFSSRYRGMCSGTMISRTAVLTAAVCVCDPLSDTQDRRAINVVAGTYYRHPRRGIKVQVTKILIPRSLGHTGTARYERVVVSIYWRYPQRGIKVQFTKILMPRIPTVEGKRGYVLEQSVAVLLLKHSVPDALAEVPVRGVAVDYLGTDGEPALQEECLTMGWHFFNYGFDKVYPPAKFLLKRYLRVQFLNVVKKHMWCEALVIKFQAALDTLGYHGIFEQKNLYCLRDPEGTSQPCHGMYGAPMICNGHVTGMLMAPDGQWTNCTGLSNLYHKISTTYLASFWKCIAGLFQPEYKLDMEWVKKSIFKTQNSEGVSFESALYDRVLEHSSSSS